MDATVIWPAGTLTPGLSELLVVVAGIVGPLALLGIGYWNVRNNSGKAKRIAERSGDSASEGPAIVSGVIELARGYSSVVHVAPERVDVKPFYLRRADGERIRVETDSRLMFALNPEDGFTRDPQKLERALRVGRKVFVSGSLKFARDPEIDDASYRDGERKGRLLRPALDDGMRVWGKDMLAHHTRRAAHHKRAARWLLLSFVAAQIFLVRFHTLYVVGSVETATVAGRSGPKSRPYSQEPTIEAWVDRWGVLSDRVSLSDYRAVEAHQPIAVVVGGPFGTLGTAPTVSFFLAGLLVLLFVGTGSRYWAFARMRA